MPARWRSKQVAVAVVAAVFTAVSVVIVVQASPEDQIARAVRAILIIGVPIVAGLFALRSPSTERFGFALIGAGLVWSLTALGYTTDSFSYSVGRVAAWLVFPLLFYLILAYPTGRLRPADRRLYAVLLAVVTVLFIGSALFVEDYPRETPWALCRDDCPPNAFLVLDSEPAVMKAVVAPVRDLIAVALMIAIIVTLVRRLRAAGRRTRRQIAPVAAASIVSCAVLVAYILTRRYTDNDATTLSWVWSFTIPGIAAAFLVGLIANRMMVAQTLERLSVALSHEPDPAGLRAVLAQTLDDPDVEVLFPNGGPGRWRDADGAEASVAAAGVAGRAVTMIDDGEAPLAALVHDPGLRQDGELLDAVRSLMLTALRHTEMQQRLAGSLRQLEDSRSRVVRAADQERSRIERDLHDGAQQRLISLRIRLSLAEELLARDPEAGRAAVAALGDEIERALAEVREIAHGVYPTVLSARGLEDALRGSLADSALPVHLITHGLSRQPAEIELAIYYVCLEALQNAQKHASEASTVWVTLRQADDELVLEVRDNGAGFVPSPSPGGLRNMSDRVESVGGSLVVDSSPGHGTRVIATVPLGRTAEQPS